MPLNNIVKKNVTYAFPTTSVEDVAVIMAEDEVGAVLIVDQGKPVGIVTDRDLVVRCLAQSKASKEMTANDVMTARVTMVNVSEGIYTAIEKVKHAHVRRVALVDDAGNALGLLSFDDLFELLSTEMESLRHIIAPKVTKFSSAVA